MNKTILAVDHTRDKSAADLNRFRQLYTFPDFVKQADPVETREPGDIPLSSYADNRPGQPAYPCHTPASTYLSCLYFAEKSAEFYHPKDAARVQQRLDRFTGYWAIKVAVDEMLTRHAELHKNAEADLPDSDFAMVWVAADSGIKHRNCRMKSAAETKAAAAWLQANRDLFAFPDRNTIALKVLEKAARYGAALGPELDRFIDQQAGLGLCEPAAVYALLANRAKIAATAFERETMQKLATAVSSQPQLALQPAKLLKLASAIDDWDRRNNLAGKYTSLIPRPEDVIFSVTYKEARAGVNSAVALTTGRVYDRNEFKKIALSDLQSMFGNSIDNVASGLDVDVEKLAEVAETFPRPDAEMFEQILADAGIPPLSSKHANYSAGISRSSPEDLAAAY